MNIKEIFENAENGTLTYEQFSDAVSKGGAKFVDLSEGNYVSKQKYEDELASKSKEIETLNGTIKTRDTDLATLKQKLTDAGTDAEKLNSLTTEFDTLKTKYDEDVKAYKSQLKKQAYEFAVKDFAGTQKFSSNASKRDFISSMLAKELKMENDKIIGADDFLAMYKESNQDAFIVESKDDNKPKITDTTSGGSVPPQKTSMFNFTGVRPKPEQK